MPTRYALIEYNPAPTQGNAGTVVNVSSVANSPPAAPSPSFRNIVEADWTVGNDPHVGDLWNGTIPAGFAPAEAPAPDEYPSDLAAVASRLTSMQAEIERIKSGIDVIQGG